MPTPLATDTQVANLESRSQIIRDIYPKGTPFLSGLKAVQAKGRTHLFQHQKLATPAIKTGVVEGGSITHAAGDMTARTEGTNQCQYFENPYEVTFDQDAVAKPGDIGDGKRSDVNKQIALKSIELVRDLDITLFASAAPVQAAQASSTAGRLGGVEYWVNRESGNRIDASAVGEGDAFLTQGLYDDATRAAYQDGGMPDKSYMGSFQKQRIARFVQNITRNIGESGKRLVEAVNSYENIIGVQDIILEPQLDIVQPGSVYQMDLMHWAIAYLRTLLNTEEGNTGSRTRGFVGLTCTLEAQAPQSSSMIANLKTR